MLSLGDVLSGLSYAADTPGALMRGGIGNLIDLFTGEDKQHGWRASTRDLLEQRGGFAPNEDGIDIGDVLGFVGDTVLDPLNLVGGGLLKRLLGSASNAKATNRGIEAANMAAKEPKVRIFRGTGPKESVDDFGNWWTEHPQYANRYGKKGQVLTTEVPAKWLAENASNVTQDEFPNWFTKQRPKGVRALTADELATIQGPVTKSKFGAMLQKIEPDYQSVVNRAFPPQPIDLIPHIPVPDIKLLLATLAGTNSAKYGDDIYDQLSN